MAKDPHDAAPEEDPEQHIGPVIKDPWDDEQQTDWGDETIDVGDSRWPS